MQAYTTSIEPFDTPTVEATAAAPLLHINITQDPRAYQNHQKPPFLGFLDRIPQNAVFWGIITINGVVFAIWTLTGQRARSEGVKEPYLWMLKNFTNNWHNFSQGRVWTPITAIFSHEGVGHILFNGFTFYFMAKPVLELLGTRKFVFLYMGGGLIASMVGMGWSNLVKHKDVPSYGASGQFPFFSNQRAMISIAPKATFQLYGIIPVPAWLAVTGIFAYDTYSAMYDKQKGTDTAAHVGGLLSGVAYYLALRFRIF
ncbi:hypothetical protein C0995_000888 [Termitomyces sp. Mi166|nr:hypothetical protein C0995_000888 [Termitomyces sp. Mi166\